MLANLNLKHCILSRLIKNRRLGDRFNPHGYFTVEHYRNKQLIGTYRFKNGITDEGKLTALNILFGTTAKKSNWYIGLIQDGGYTALADADTMASHGGWQEFTGYSESTRPEWDPADTATTSITNSTARTFTITSGDTLKGIFISEGNAKGGTTGVLWATGLFDADIAVNSTDELKISYTVET